MKNNVKKGVDDAVVTDLTRRPTHADCSSRQGGVTGAQVTPPQLRRVLFISYAFPPTGGGGVQRSVKFAKYLPKFAWRPTILTVANPSVPVHDHDFASDLDPTMNIVRARTLEPGYAVKKQIVDNGTGTRKSTRFLRSILRNLSARFFQPDPQILWNPQAYRAAKRTLRSVSHDAILVTGPPFSSFLLGCKLKQKFGLPLILDFRDEWMIACRYLENQQQRDKGFHKQQTMMLKTLQFADAVITTTQASASELQKHCDEINSRARVICIYNGFDPDDIDGVALPSPRSEKLQITYTGTLWKLTDISPFVSALVALHQASPERCARLKLSIAGRRTPPQDVVLERLNDTKFTIEPHGYLAHKQSLQLATDSDILLLLLSDQPGAERVVPAKLFEYLALGKTILAIVPLGETRNLMRGQPNCHLFHPSETDKIARWLSIRLDAHSLHHSGNSIPTGSSADAALTSEFSRLNLTSQLADVLQKSIQI